WGSLPSLFSLFSFPPRQQSLVKGRSNRRPSPLPVSGNRRFCSGEPLTQSTEDLLKMKMDVASGNIDVEMVVSYCDDLVKVLRDKTNVNDMKQCVKYSKAIQSSSKNDLSEVRSSIKDCQNKIDDCKKKIEEAKLSVVADEELQQLQNQLDEELKREQTLREEFKVIEEKIDQLGQQRLSIEERSRSLKKVQEEVDKAETKLSFYASVTNVIPDLQNQSRIAGQIVQRDKQ
ncbi:Kinetochore protein SPC24-like protein, partial [Drosera capensis]